MLEVTLLFVLCLLITLGLFEFARWLWVYYAMGSAARQGASYATAHGAGSARPADKGKIQAVAREAFYVPGLIPQDLVVHTSWKPDNEIFSKVQVRTAYNFEFMTPRLLFPQQTIALVRASPVMVINPRPAKAQSTKNRAVIKSWARPQA